MLVTGASFFLDNGEPEKYFGLSQSKLVHFLSFEISKCWLLDSAAIEMVDRRVEPHPEEGGGIGYMVKRWSHHLSTMFTVLHPPNPSSTTSQSSNRLSHDAIVPIGMGACTGQRFSSLLVLIVLALASARGQIWDWQNPLPQGNGLFSVSTAGLSTFWVAGGGGALMRSTDAGGSWQLVSSPARIWILSLFFLDEQIGWVGGQADDGHGVVFCTTNGGQSWIRQLDESYGDIRTITFIDRRHGWASGQSGNIYFTSDGGDHWDLQTALPTQFIYRLCFLDSLQGYGVASPGRFISSTDGGFSWRLDTLAFDLYDMAVRDSDNIWICGIGQIAHSSNNGRSWQTSLDTLSNVRWISLAATTGDTVRSVSDGGIFAQTTDAGTTWNMRPFPTSGNLKALAFLDSVHGLAVGLDPTMLLTTNGGTSWNSVTTSVTRDQLNGISLLSRDTCWMAGGTTVLKTTNGGATWLKMQQFSTNDLRDITFIDDSHGWVVGRGGTIFRTTDGGNQWTVQSSHITIDLLDIDFSNYPIGWIVGGGVGRTNVLLKTTDGGDSWYDVSPVVLPWSTRLLRFPTTNSGWILSGGGSSDAVQAIFHTQDGGMTWIKTLSISSPSGIVGLDAYGETVAWATSLSDTLFKTTDGGSTWQSFSVPETFSVLFFLDSALGWAGSTTGEVYATTDGGLSWSATASPLGQHAVAIGFADPKHGWVTGERGSVIHTGDRSTDVKDPPDMDRHTGGNRLPNLQCYPNPSNGFIHIFFTVYSPTPHLRIVVYDILGREVYEESHQALSSGSYTCEWNGVGRSGNVLGSGIYFLELQTEMGRVAMKLVFMK